MIFIFNEDCTLTVVASIADVQMNCEGIDVENGVFKFFDENGTCLEPYFIKPNEKGHIIGPVGWVISGQYSLKPSTKSDAPSIFKLLDSGILLEKNAYFKNIEEIKRFLTIASRGSQETRPSS